ncbi:TPR repeat-containing protein [Desulfonatronospira thiodismutans ASO3-1]|uniref:TPR repeat-containing protein n=2 Tax=Desulfonatronospira thiodismutans TaxID=488939 RepID=D6SLC3_9BACT|nr:TPR repeat-containing protein [Desulfonatronospira thiodismutans ASO3-1]
MSSMFKPVSVLIICLVLSACSMPRIAVLSDPLTAGEHNDLGVSYELMGEMELALKQYELAYENDREWDQPLINHGNVHAGLENWERAEESYRKALERSPDNPEAMNNLAYVLMKQDKNDDALDWSAKAVKIQPENPAFLNTHARACLKTGNPDKAKRIFTRALSQLPDEDPLRERVKEGLKEVENK